MSVREGGKCPRARDGRRIAAEVLRRVALLDLDAPQSVGLPLDLDGLVEVVLARMSACRAARQRSTKAVAEALEVEVGIAQAFLRRARKRAEA